MKPSSSSRRRFFALLCATLGILGVLFFKHWQRLPDGELTIDFLDIGQGDAILITTPSSETILIDGGPDATVLQELGEVMPFLHRRLDLVVLTHPHADHVTGLIQVLRRYEVGAVLISGVNYDSALYAAFLDEVAQQHIPLSLARASDDWHFGDVTLDVLYPFESMTGTSMENVNNASVVLMVEYRDHRILLSGDAEQEVETELLAAQVDVDADIFKAGHHGSRTSSTEPFLDAVTPEIAIIQCGTDNEYGHPHPETLEHFQERSIPFYRNDLQGRVRVVCGEAPACTVIPRAQS
jgi:competence protein ComEC